MRRMLQHHCHHHHRHRNQHHQRLHHLESGSNWKHFPVLRVWFEGIVWIEDLCKHMKSHSEDRTREWNVRAWEMTRGKGRVGQSVSELVGAGLLVACGSEKLTRWHEQREDRSKAIVKHVNQDDILIAFISWLIQLIQTAVNGCTDSLLGIGSDRENGSTYHRTGQSSTMFECCCFR